MARFISRNIEVRHTDGQICRFGLHIVEITDNSHKVFYTDTGMGISAHTDAYRMESFKDECPDTAYAEKIVIQRKKP